MGYERNKKLPQMAVALILTYVTKNSLPNCYKSVNEWLFDFYPDLNWDPQCCVEDIRDVLDHPEFTRIQAWFIKRYGFDFEHELNEALEEKW